jgi:hypothetical protein
MATDPLLNVKELAAELKRHPQYVAAMKAFGYEFSHGNRTTYPHALAWLGAHPDFRSTGYRANSPEFVKSQTHPQRRRLAAAGMTGAPAH